MKVIAFLWIFLGTFVGAVEAATSVWKVQSGKDYFYLAGTVHLLPASEFPLPAAFEQAYADSKIIWFEAELPAPNDPALSEKMRQILQYPAGEQLSQKLTPQVAKQLNQFLVGHGLSLAQLDSYKAGYLVLQMSLLEMQKAGMGGQGVDAYFDQKAKQDGKSRAFFETLDFQLQLIGGLGQGRENQFIADSLQQVDTAVALVGKTIQAWRRGDLRAIEQETLQLSRDSDPISHQQMFSQRNLSWSKQLPQLFNNKEIELVLVGAGHLAGADGLIALLQQAGYQVKPL